jgi:tetrahydromethanopterin S-methyltransferase subunit E
MAVYGHPITYGTMGTVLAAVAAAFLSRILLQEMNKIFEG